MKKLLFYFAAVAVMVACKKDEPTDMYPKEIPFVEYSLEGSNAEWINQRTFGDPASNLAFAIDNDIDLRRHIAGDYPPIDFSKKMLIIADGGIAHEIYSIEKQVRQMSKKIYEFGIKLSLSSERTEEGNYWRIAILIDKLTDGSTITTDLVENFIETRATVTTEYKIVNRIESDIVVELKSDGGQIITIKPGDTEEVHRAKEQFVLREGRWYDMENRPVDEVLYEYYRVLNAEMKIDGEVVTDAIWRDDYWDIDSESSIEKSLFVINRAGILTVTDELLETVNNQ